MRAAVAGCLAIVLLASACSGGGGRSAEQRPDTSPSTSVPSGDDSPADEATAPDAPRQSPVSAPSPPRARDDRRGRAAFAEYVLQAWIYALNTNDADPLLEVSGPRPCDGCAGLVAELESRADEGWYVDLRDVRVASTRARAGTGTTSVLLSVSLPESDTYFEDGTYRSTNPAHPGSTFEVEMTYVNRRFRLEAFSLY